MAKEGTFSEPFIQRQEFIVAVQHSRRHGAIGEDVHAVEPVQLAQPALHFMVESVVSFFSCKDNEREGERAVHNLQVVKTVNTRLRYLNLFRA